MISEIRKTFCFSSFHVFSLFLSLYNVKVLLPIFFESTPSTNVLLYEDKKEKDAIKIMVKILIITIPLIRKMIVTTAYLISI